jgi:hypothetical protein
LILSVIIKDTLIPLADAEGEAALDEFEKSLSTTMRAKEAQLADMARASQNSSNSSNGETFSRDSGARWHKVASNRIIQCADFLIAKRVQADIHQYGRWFDDLLVIIKSLPLLLLMSISGG